MTNFEDNLVVEKSEENRSLKELDPRKDIEESVDGKLTADQISRQEDEAYTEKSEKKDKETKEEKQEYEKNIGEEEKKEDIDEKEHKKVKKHKKKHHGEENKDEEKMDTDEGKEVKVEKAKKEKKDKKDKKAKKEKCGKDDVEKLQKKLEKIDAKLQKILAKKENYIQKIKSAEEKKKGDGVVAQLESLIINGTDREMHAEGDAGIQGESEKSQGTVKSTETKAEDEQFPNTVTGKEFEDTETVGGHDKHKEGVSYADAVRTSDVHPSENISG